MRREGIASLELTIFYAAGTIAGVALGAAILHFVDEPIALALLATAVAAFARLGFAISPALGFMAFTLFLLFASNMIFESGGIVAPHLLETRIYDVTVGCLIALAGTLAATYPRVGPARTGTMRGGGA